MSSLDPHARDAELSELRRELERVRAAQELHLSDLARRAAERSDWLLRFTTAAGEAMSEGAVAEVVLRELSGELGAVGGVVCTLTPDGGALQSVAGFGEVELAFRAASPLRLDAHAPLCEAVRRRGPLVFEDLATAALAYPVLRGIAVDRSGGLAAIPLVSRDGAAVGALAIMLPPGRRFDGELRALAQALAGQCAQAMERARLYQAEKRARAESELRADRMRRLQSVIFRLSRALSGPEVGEAVIDEGTEAVGARTGAIWLLDETGQHLQLLRARSYPNAENYARVPLDRRSPLGDAVLRRAPVWLESYEAYQAGYPVYEAKTRGEVPDHGPGTLAIACLPLVIDDRLLGGLAFSFATSRRFEPDERAFLLALAQHGAQGLERARLYDAERAARQEAEAAHRRAAFLAEASLLLSSSLDLGAMLPRLADLAVPGIADWCAVDLLRVESRQLVMAALAHQDPLVLEQMRELRRQRPVDVDRSGSTAAVVVRSGEAMLLPQITDDRLTRSAMDEEHLRILREHAYRSVMAVPIAARGQVLGSITLATAGSGRAYGPADLKMARQLGERAGMAIDNARLYHQAVQAVSVRDEFLSIAGHELRTPLTPILLEAQVLSRLTDGADLDWVRARARARNLLTNALRMGRLIDDLLDVSRISGGRLLLELEEIELGELVAGVVRRAESQAERDGTELRLDVAGPARGRWDRTRVEQVVSNLLGNALKYGRGRPVEVQVRAEPGQAVVQVRDQGIGIAPEDQARIFLRFERAASPTHFAGLGLGLWIAREIADAHGGRIRVDSRPGQGATFTLELPLLAVQERDGAPP